MKEKVYETTQATADVPASSAVGLPDDSPYVNRLLGKVSIGTALGACAGVASKKLTHQAMHGVGVGFICLQVLAYKGWISINWKKVKSDIEKVADQDGDGEFTGADLKNLIRKGVAFLRHGVPDAVGFTAGFYAAIRYF